MSGAWSCEKLENSLTSDALSFRARLWAGIDDIPIASHFFSLGDLDVCLYLICEFTDRKWRQSVHNVWREATRNERWFSGGWILDTSKGTSVTETNRSLWTAIRLRLSDSGLGLPLPLPLVSSDFKIFCILFMHFRRWLFRAAGLQSLYKQPLQVHSKDHLSMGACSDSWLMESSFQREIIGWWNFGLCWGVCSKNCTNDKLYTVEGFEQASREKVETVIKQELQLAPVHTFKLNEKWALHADTCFNKIPCYRFDRNVQSWRSAQTVINRITLRSVVCSRMQKIFDAKWSCNGYT